MKPIEIIKFKDGCQMEVYRDEDPGSPREWDNLGTMVCFHKNYDLGDKHNYKSGDYNGWDELKRHIQEEDNPDCLIRPLFLMNHSELSISMAPFGCRWDSGQVGFIFITKEIIVSQLKGDVFRAEEILQAEIETYNQYLHGDIYGFILLDKPCDKCGCNTKSEVLDSCWNFYGRDPVENGMIEHLSKEHRDDIFREKTNNEFC